MREENHSNTKTFAVATLGCKVNQADSEAISEQMNAAGFVQREFNEAADIYIVNTCTVTHLGDRSSRLMISQAHRRQPEALLVVTGCYAERNPDGVAALPGVDLVIGNQQKDALVETIQSHQQTTSADETMIAVAETPVSRETARGTLDLAQETSLPGQAMLAGLRQLLPVLDIQEQHIGSDIALEIDPDEAEPQPDNPGPAPLITRERGSESGQSRAPPHTHPRANEGAGWLR